MPNTPDTDPRLIRLPPAGTVARELAVDAVNIGLRLALLTDGQFVPIVDGFDRFGEDCDLGSVELHAFVCGSDRLGWWDCLVSDWNLGLRVH